MQYLVLMLLCLAVTLPLEFVLGARVYRQPRRIMAVLIPTAAVFVAWDWIAVDRGHWAFVSRYLTGLRLGPLPVEELVFFVAIPVCTLLTFEVVQRILRRGGRDA
jgi:lycopene cyclase domain-containing protein